MYCSPFTCGWLRSLCRSKRGKVEDQEHSEEAIFHEDPRPPRPVDLPKGDRVPNNPVDTPNQEPSEDTQFTHKRPGATGRISPPSEGICISRPKPPPTEASDVGRLDIVSWNGDSALDDSTQDRSRDFANIGEQFSGLPDVGIGAGASEALQEQLLRAQIEWPESENKYFLPADAIQRLVTVDSILLELRRCEIDLSEPGRLAQHAQFISAIAPRLFAILVYIGESQHVMEFLKEGIDDTDLPLTRFVKASEETTTAPFTLCTSKYSNQSVASMKSWSRKQIIAFDRDQWVMLAPIFKAPKEGKKLKHYELGKNRVMPYIEDRELTSQTAGGFGSVWGVRIHPAHQFLCKGNNPEDPNPLMALKRLHSRDRKGFNVEVEMLKNFCDTQNPHLVKLLATYSWRGSYYLVFPLASANLREYWERTPTPDFSTRTVSWVLRQCKGIASAIVAIHEFRHSRFRKQEGVLSGVQANLSPSSSHRGRKNEISNSAAPGENERLYGRHGDIKPENILWSVEKVYGKTGTFDDKGLLLLADFGLMAFHGKLTKSNVPPDTITGSPSYAPPEFALRKGISRAYDIWSLGCVFLEFVTWLLCGHEYLNTFPDVRDQTGLDGFGYDDTFFTIVENRTAIVRESVTEWMNNLRENDRCSEFVREFLDLISDGMLVVNPSKRLNCGGLNSALARMINKSNINSEYLTSPVPSPPRKPNEAAKQVNEVLHGKCPMSPPPKPQEGSALPEYQARHSLTSFPTSPKDRVLVPQSSLPQFLVTSTSTPFDPSMMSSRSASETPDRLKNSQN